MDPGLKMYLSNNNKKFWSKMIFEQQHQKKFPIMLFFSEKNLGKNLGKNFFGKKTEKNLSTSSNYT